MLKTDRKSEKKKKFFCMKKVDNSEKPWYNNKAVGRESEAQESGKCCILGKMKSLFRLKLCKERSGRVGSACRETKSC